jgi:hypothetical protein
MVKNGGVRKRGFSKVAVLVLLRRSFSTASHLFCGSKILL